VGQQRRRRRRFLRLVRSYPANNEVDGIYIIGDKSFLISLDVGKDGKREGKRRGIKWQDYFKRHALRR
jgi:hypothetical protein